jgi:uncharacterized membrane protein
MHKTLALALTLGACLWTAVLFAAPYALVSSKPALVASAALIYQGAGFICHQRSERSFHLGGVQQPVCGRCTGLYISGALGALAAWFAWHPRMPRRTRSALLFAAIPTALTVSLELAGLMSPSNMVRAASALPLGATAGWIFIRSLRVEAEDARRATYAPGQPS